MIKKEAKVLLVLLTIFLFVLILFISFIVIELFIFDCPITNGILFFPNFVFTSSVFGFAMALILSSVEGKRSYLILSLIIFILILYSLIGYYYEPSLYLFNPLVIFFPGLVYNEIFEFDLRTFIYIAGLIISSIMIIINYALSELSAKNPLQKFKLHFQIFPLIILCGLFIFSDKIGLSTSQNKLNNVFGTSIKEKKFEVYFEKPIQNKIELEIYRWTTKFHFKNLEEKTGISPEKIKIFVFENDKSKRELLGDEAADFTKPWLKQIFVTKNSFDQTIKHELAHVFLGEKSENIFHVAGGLNLGLIEGGAVALEWEWLEQSPKYFSSLITNFVGNFSFNDFFKNYSFATRLSYVSYLMAGSFCKYLIDKYGMEKFLDFYSSGDFEKVFNKNAEDEFQFFLSDLKIFQLNSKDSLKAKILFGSQPFVLKKCARAISRINKKAFQLFEQKRYKEAELLFQRIYELRRDNEAFYNLLRVKFSQKKFNQVLSLYQNSEINKKLVGLASLRSAVLYALSLGRLGRIEEAKQIIEELIELKISSSWNSYLELISVLLNDSENIDFIAENPFTWQTKILKSPTPEKLILWKYFLDLISEEQLDEVVKNFPNEFWLLNKSFYRYLELGNFVKAKNIINIIKENNLANDEVKLYNLDLMIYLLENISKTGV
ncbi:MAG: hypothetical protein N3F03_02770 [Ignavibacteria bacterium]|nr:hypothetical protein [Ignavibacteria bacterium]